MKMKMQNLDIGAYVDQNQRYRNYMEDEYFIDQSSDKYKLIGIFDGHGGDFVSKELKMIVPQTFKKWVGENNIDPLIINKQLQQTFLECNSKLETAPQAQECGSTGIVAVLYPNPKQNPPLLMSIANVGDSSGYLFDKSNGIRLSYDHKASDIQEKDRIEKNNGQVYYNRVQGILAITRAFGDFILKQNGVIANPFMWPEPLELYQSYEFLILASDGIWDMYATQEELSKLAQDLQQMKQKQMKCEEIAKIILNKAKDLGSRDNLSIIVARIQ